MLNDDDDDESFHTMTNVTIVENIAIVKIVANVIGSSSNSILVSCLLRSSLPVAVAVVVIIIIIIDRQQIY